MFFFRNRDFKYIIPSLTLLLSACANHQTNPQTPLTIDSPEWQQRQQQLAQLKQFQLQGSLGYIGETRVYARFNWQQQASDRYRLLLTSTLGSSALQLDKQQQMVSMVDSEGKRYKSDDAQQLLSKLTGMKIPLNNLRQWILGLPGAAQHYKLDSNAYLTEAEYQESGTIWRLKILNYNQKIKPALPESIEVTTANQRIKLHMDNWTLP